MILITGVPGWIGNRFVEMLLDGTGDTWNPGVSGQKLRCLVLPGAKNDFIGKISGRVDIVEGDVTRPETLKDFFAGSEGATLFHLAGIIHPQKRIKELCDVNVRGTYHALAAARAGGVQKVVLLSSNSQSGTNPSVGHRFTEDSPYNPYLHYGRSKMMMERVGQTCIRSHGMDVTIIRACWFYGPHQPLRQTRFFSLIKTGRFPLVAGGTSCRSLSYVDDICQGMLLAAKNKESRGKIYWIASERAYPMREIIATVGNVMEQEFHLRVMPPRMRLPSMVSDMAYGADRMIQSLGLYQQEIHVLSEMNKTIACSIERARRELGYKPAVSLYEGMNRSIRWCLEQGYDI